MEDDIKLVFFDMEGTIFRKEVKDSKGNTSPSAWTVIAEELGEQAAREEDRTKDKWNNDVYDGYVEWMEDTINIHKKYGLKKDQFEQILGSIEYREGVEHTFQKLHENGIKTALITGGFKRQADRAQKDLKIDHAFAACEYHWSEDGSIEHWNLLPVDYEGKVDFMKLIMEEHGLSPEECAFVGDGSNDVELAREVGLSISYNGPEELEAAASYIINQERDEEDFSEILDYLLYQHQN